MTSHIPHAAIFPAAWHSHGDDWLFIVADKLCARMERDGARWLCHALDEHGDGWFLGQCLSLADGKAHLFLRYALQSSANCIADGEPPM